jgi:CHAT domain/Subtilase family/AAA ATPase domain
MAEDSRFEYFDLTVNLGPERIPWLSATSRIGLLHGIPRTDSTMPALDDLLDLVHDYRDAVQFAENHPVDEISKALGRLIFGEPQILELFQATRGAAADRGKPTLIRILASPHLATLPWELLPDPAARNSTARASFLTLAPDAHVVRMARGRTYASRNEQLKPPLNLLIVLSSPSPLKSSDDSLAFDIYEVKRSLLTELEPLIRAGLLRVEIEDRPTLENLRRRVGGVSRGFHLFHYVGHALPDRLILEDASGRREDQDSAHICEILRLCPDLRLAVFAGCETARASTEAGDLDARLAVGWRDLVSLADRCVQEACPMVIGMQAVLPFRTERLFTRFFYQGLASGYSIAESLQLARGAARSDSRVAAELLDWSVPALFMGTGEPGPLIERNAKGTPPTVARRCELKIGLKQSETRFFARDLALRQAVDLLASRTRERILVLTGSVGVGKTTLVDRAIEELGDAASHVLYVKLGRLAPPLELALERLRQGTNHWDQQLETFTPEAVLQELCSLVADLLSQGDAVRREQGALRPEVWWERLTEELTRARFVMVFDECDLLDDLLEAACTRWLQPVVAKAFMGPRKSGGARRVTLIETTLDLIQTPDSRARRNSECARFLRDIESQLKVDAPWIKAIAHRVLETQLLNRLESEATPSKLTSSQTPSTPSATLTARQIQQLTTKADAVRSTLERALQQIGERRSSSRIALITAPTGARTLRLPSVERFEMRIGHLSWQETWRWIRRNLPGLTRYSETDLAKIWLQFGPELERWEALEQAILSGSRAGKTLQQLIGEVAPPRTREKTPSTPAISLRRGRRPLRLAVAGQHIRSPEAFAEALSRLANEYGIGGRITLGPRDGAATLGELVSPPSPFEENGIATDATITQWLEAALTERPDIVLLDYGAPFPLDTYKMRKTPEREVMAHAAHRCLFIAAGGNSGPQFAFEPAVFPEAFAVGALDEESEIRDFSGWLPQYNKPDVFMLDNLEGTAIASAFDLGRSDRMEGTSFSAFHATAAAVLAWSLIPELRPAELRRLMQGAARPFQTPIPGARDPEPVRLTIGQVVDAARMRLIEDVLRTGPCLPESLAAVAGQDTVYIRETLETMVADGRVLRTLSGRLERYQLADT